MQQSQRAQRVVHRGIRAGRPAIGGHPVAQYGAFEERVVYHEVMRPFLLVYDHGDDKGDNSHRVTVRFLASRDGKTELTMRSVFPSAAARDYVVTNYNAIEMGTQTLDKLEAHLARG